MNLAQLEEVLCQVPTVDAVRIVGHGNDVEEVHVVASTSKPAKQVVRDIQSLALASHGVTLDRRVISVVQLSDGTHLGGERIEIIDVAEQVEGTTAQVTVALGLGANQALGVAKGSSAQVVRSRLIGEATISALTQMLPGGPVMALAALEVTPLGTRTIAVSQVALVTGGQEQVFVGSALAEEDTRMAAVRSVLDAINRVFPKLAR
ncbi:MAG: hypothetical protein HKN46_02365 [Acidimicrobiia bacterium]|nr:hypothetical protein [Acidimicrobiia bacterium]